MKRRVSALAVLGIMLATVGAWLQTPSRTAPSSGLAALLPAGATLVLQAKDFGSLVRDWNASSGKARWLESANYQAFSRSRLFLRLEEAYGEFASAAGVPPDMALVSDVAGAESALALYDIGKLEFLYVTRLPSAKAMENALWRTRGEYEPREAAGTPFYVRVDEESKRVVAFAARDGYLLLATREDLLAGALTLIGGRSGPGGGAGGGTAVDSEGWFTQAVKAAGAPGDLRLVMHLDALVKAPHFRSYWIQGNVAELKAFSSAVSDLVRTPSDLRETRVLLRAQEPPAAASASGSGGTGNAGNAASAATLGALTRLVPDTAGLYRAWASPSPEQATQLIVEKVVATSGAAAMRDRTAPRLSAGAGVTGSEADLESRVDEETPAPRPTSYDTAALAQLVGRETLTGLLHVESTRPGGDGIFITRGSVVVIARGSDWPAGAARDAVRAVVDPVWTKAHLGMRWVDVQAGTRAGTGAGAQTVSQLDGLETVIVAERGRLLFVANDLALLGAVLDATSKPAASLDGVYAAGFRHAQERERFDRLTRFLDHAAAGAESHAPLFFSENLSSLSETLSSVDSASIVVQDAGATVSQQVTYRLRP
jgi:hypothetical protein